jgi:hypothetical protein
MLRVLSIWAAILGALVVVTSIYGGYHYFSPIPFWDQWDGYIGFFRDLPQLGIKDFWMPHNEHRIVLARVIFWIDIVAFGGWNILPIVLIYASISAMCLIFFREFVRGAAEKPSLMMVAGLIAGMLFLWCQNENLKWGFQVQFLAVYLFAIAAFAQYSRANNNRDLACALLLCVLSTLSMANGVASFFVMAIQGVLLRRNRKEICITLFAGFLAAIIYFYKSKIEPIPISVEAARMHFAGLKFFLAFMGNPFFFVKGNLLLCAVAGIAVTVTSAICVAPLYIGRRITPYRGFLIACFGMIVASALGATHGRWMAGLWYSVLSRYTTPTLIGYLALILLLIDVASTRFARVLTCAAAIILMTTLSLYQKNAFGDNSLLFDWRLAVLGQKIGLDHDSYDSLLYPLAGHNRYIERASYAAQKGIGPYGSGWLHDAGIVRYDSSLRDDSLCVGFLEIQERDSVGATARGWAVTKRFAEPGTLIVLANTAGETVGYGVTGMARPDVPKGIAGSQRHPGWVGFARQDEGPLSAYAYVGNRFCKLKTIK